MAIAMHPLWCAGTLDKYLFESGAMLIDVTKTGDDTKVSIGDKVAVPTESSVTISDPSLGGGIIAIRISDCIAKVT